MRQNPKYKTLLVVSGPSGSGKSTFVRQLYTGTLQQDLQHLFPEDLAKAPSVDAKYPDRLLVGSMTDTDGSVLLHDVDFQSLPREFSSLILHNATNRYSKKRTGNASSESVISEFVKDGVEHIIFAELVVEPYSLSGFYARRSFGDPQSNKSKAKPLTRWLQLSKIMMFLKYRYTDFPNEIDEAWKAIREEITERAFHHNANVKVSQYAIEPCSDDDGCPSFQLVEREENALRTNSLIVRISNQADPRLLRNHLQRHGATCSQVSNRVERSSAAPDGSTYLKVHLPVEGRTVEDRIRQLRRLVSDWPDHFELSVLVSNRPSTTRISDQLLGVRSHITFVGEPGNGRVKKQFYPFAEDYYRREIAARNSIRSTNIVPASPSDELCVETPYIKQRDTFAGGLFSYYDIDNARAIMRLVESINKQGFALVDWNPGSFLIDQNMKINIVDLEYCQPTDLHPARFEDSVDYNGARRYGLTCPGRSDCGYGDFWYPILGVNYKTLMFGNLLHIRSMQIMHFFLLRLPKWIGLKLQRTLSFSRKNIWYYCKRGRWLKV